MFESFGMCRDDISKEKVQTSLHQSRNKAMVIS